VLDFLFALNRIMNEKEFQYWDKASSLKEDFRSKTRLGVSGEENQISLLDLNAILNNFLSKLNIAIENAFDKDKGLYCTYFINEVTEYTNLNPLYIKPIKFKQIRLPFFLESQVHALRLAKDLDEAKNLYKAVKKSVLYDKELKMYRVTASLEKLPQEIGRCRVFSPGWLENESIWLHMEYKYLLGLLQKGLYDEFYKEFKNVLIPFQKPERYGRSILENSSFLVSSVFQDKKLHGNGFVARLSGSTAEFLTIWLMINLGRNPFFLNEKAELNLCFEPVLKGWLFDKKGTYSFNFLSKIYVTYHNPKRKDTFGSSGVRPYRIEFKDTQGNMIELNSNIIPSPYAPQIRNRLIKTIEVYFT
ncbi:MAG: cellobiose phosphorylase, partial [Candidatus Omnitrophica bacterium]|nr:cellobiose phosphorylase [Candidatus Omnitrophota bacterium]